MFLVEPPITQSLFTDKNATISEENIQKILDGKYKLPENLRVAIVKIDQSQKRRNYYWSNEDLMKSQQAYLELFSTGLKASPRVKTISVIPDILVSGNPTFTNIRESAVRTQADIVIIYSIASDIYSKYKFFTKPDIKGFATTQLLVLDVRTGLIPFSTIVTRDYKSSRKEGELNNDEAANRIKSEAVLSTINEISRGLTEFLAVK